MSSAAANQHLSWPPQLAHTPAVAVIERAIQNHRLSHSLLIMGDDIDLLDSVATTIADRLLNTGTSTRNFHPEQHPDCFHLRPAKKARIIDADSTRDLIDKVQVSPVLAPVKVAIIHECDRMNVTAANIFLKTLEEPPPNTMLLLLTTHPHTLLPTILSRCLHFRFPGADNSSIPPGWDVWLQTYNTWLTNIANGTSSNSFTKTDAILNIYALVSRFQTILQEATDAAWDLQKTKLPDELDDEEIDAIKSGIARGIRSHLFASIAHATRAFAVTPLQFPTTAAPARRAFTDTLATLDHNNALFALNLKPTDALETFLLTTLRLWHAKTTIQ